MADCLQSAIFHMEDRNVLKFWVALGIIVAVFFFCFGVRVFAYEQNDLPWEIFYQNTDYPSSSDSRYLYYTSQNPYSSDYLTIADTHILGYNIGSLAPYYSDGDHVSIFMAFGLSIPRVNFQGSNNTWGGEYRLLISPSSYRNYMDFPNGLLAAAVIDLKSMVSNNVSSQQLAGHSTWQNEQIDYKMLVYHGGDGAMYGQGFVPYEHFYFNIQLDLDLTQSRELLPLSVFFWQMYEAVGAYPSWRVDTRPIIRLNDTSMYGLLSEIKDALDTLDFSALVDLGQLSATISQIYASVSLQNDILESLIDEEETDPELTEWAGVASQFESKNAYMHSLEEDMIGTLADFTFPDAPSADNSIVGNVVLPWFENPIVIALTLAGIALMIVFAIL